MRLRNRSLAALIALLAILAALAPRAAAQAPESAATITVGLDGVVSGELTASDGGSDWYAFQATGGEPYIIEAKPAYTFTEVDEFGNGGHPVLVPGYIVDVSILEVVDSEGVQLLDEQDQGGFTLNAARAFFVPPADGTYYVAVGAGARDRAGLGHYTISVRRDDHPDDFRTPPGIVLRPGESIAAAIDSDVAPDDERLNSWDWKPVGWSDVAMQMRPRQGIESLDDRDLFRFEIAVEGSYRLKVENDLIEAQSGRDGPAAIWEVKEYMGNLYAYPENGPALSFVDWYAPGAYYVEVGTAYESSGNTVGYALLLDSFPLTDELGDCPTRDPDDCTLQVGRAKTGVIDGLLDADHWSVSLEGGRTYVVHVKGAGDRSGGGDNGGTLGDPFLALRRPGALTVAANDDIDESNLNSRLTYIVPTDAGGVYTVLVQRRAGHTPLFATYTVLVEEVDPLPLDETRDCPETRPTDCEVTLGEPLRGMIERAGDGSLETDAWKVRLDQGKRYIIEVKGAGDLSGGNDNGGTLPNPAVGLIEDSGVTVAAHDDVSVTNRNARLVTAGPVEDAGVYVILVSGLPGADGSPGTYTVSVRQVDRRE